MPLPAFTAGQASSCLRALSLVCSRPQMNRLLPLLLCGFLVGCSQNAPVNPNLMKCPVCAADISKLAPSCPHCGQPNPHNEQKREEFEALWQNSPTVGEDIVEASGCSIQHGKVIGLKLRGWPLQDDGLQHISTLADLKWLEVASPSVTDGGMKHLANLRSLVRLQIDDTSMTAHTLGVLANLPNISHVALNGVQFSESGVNSLIPIATLERITLSGSNISDATLIGLTRLKQLKYVYLGETGVTEEGIAKVKAALPKVTFLRENSLQPL